MENQEQTPVNPLSQPEESRSTKKFTIAIVVLLVLWIGSSIGAMTLWNKEKQKVTQLNSQIETLTRDTKENITQTDITPGESKETVASETTYSAKIGKFSLQLPSAYAVVQDLDGGGEGGPATFISVGTKIEGNAAVINNSMFENVEIFANPNRAQFQTLQAFIDEEIPADQIVSRNNIEVAGVSAQSFELTGLAENQAIYFEKNNIFYTIKLFNSAPPERQAMLQTVISGFSFN